MRHTLSLLTIPLLAPAIGAADDARTGALGVFEQVAEVGQVELRGSAAYNAAKQQYRITGSGKNIWSTEDAFQFVYRRLSGDLMLQADVAWEGPGAELHRKVCAMVRQTLDADSPYVDVAVHGDGLIELQFRAVKGGLTRAARTPIQAPATVKLERDGDVFTVSVAKVGGVFQPVGAWSLHLPDPVYVGLAVSAHNARNLETALCSNVQLTSRQAGLGEQRVQETTLETLDVATGERRVVHRERGRFEAPNWTPDGKLFYINKGGQIWTLPVAGGEPMRLDTGAARGNNNDHGLSFDGQWLAISSAAGPGGSKIYVLPAAGGEPRLVTPVGPSYWHGWSPDGRTLTYCAERHGNYDIYTIPTQGGEERRLTDAPGLDDGPEYTPDGARIYFHSERAGGVPKIFRMNPDGTAQEQVTFDEQYADWFPHPSPDGRWLVFMSYDQSVKGHPPNRNVVLRLMPLTGGQPKVVATLFGGQGTINVPSWSPDSTRLAFVSYRHVLAPAAAGQPSRKLTVGEAVAETRAVLQARKVSDILGVTHAHGQYALTDKPFLIEGAEAVSALGARIIKLWFYPIYERMYPWHSEWPRAVADLEALARTPYYEAVFAMPFHTYVLETCEFLPTKGFWARGVSAADRAKVHDDIYRLARHLLTRYRGTGKTFVLQNWEADNDVKLTLKDAPPSANAAAFQGLADWLNTRQAAVEQARRECGTDGVLVLNALEVNWVPPLKDLAAGKAYTKNRPLVVDEVVPRTHCDLYSLSSWETWAPGTEASVYERLQYLAAKAPHDGLLGRHNLMLGEFGAHEAGFENPDKTYPIYRGDTSGAALYALHQMLDAALRAGVRYVLHWQLYDNDLRMGGKYEGKGLPPGVMATAEQCVGNWLIRPDGSRVPTYDYFRGLFDAESQELRR